MDSASGVVAPACGEAVGERVGQPVGEERAEDGGSDAAADLPEVVVGTGRGAEVGRTNGVLHGDHQDRHHHADADTEDRHPDAVMQPGSPGVEAGEQPHAEGREGAAEDREDLVAAAAADELPGDDGGDDDAAHHGEHQEPGFRRTGTVDHLQERGEITGGPEEGGSDDQTDERGDVEDRVPEQPQGDEGVDREALDDEEEHRRGDRARHEREDDP